MKALQIHIAALVGLAILAAPLTAYAGGHGRTGGRQGGMMGPLAGLDLTDAQEEAVEQLQESTREQGTDLRIEMRRLQHDLEGEMLEEKPDAGKVRELAEQIGGIRTQLEIQHLEMRLAIRELLTEEQLDQLLSRPRMGLGRRGDRGPQGGHQRHHGCPRGSSNQG